jgi:hypothetical protein
MKLPCYYNGNFKIEKLQSNSFKNRPSSNDKMAKARFKTSWNNTLNKPNMNWSSKNNPKKDAPQDLSETGTVLLEDTWRRKHLSNSMSSPEMRSHKTRSSRTHSHVENHSLLVKKKELKGIEARKLLEQQ